MRHFVFLRKIPIAYVGRKKSIENYFDKMTIKWFPVNHTSAFLGHNKSTTQTVWFENSFSVNVLLIRSVITYYVIFFFQVEISCLCIHFTYFLHSLNTAFLLHSFQLQERKLFTKSMYLLWVFFCLFAIDWSNSLGIHQNQLLYGTFLGVTYATLIRIKSRKHLNSNKTHQICTSRNHFSA